MKIGIHDADKEKIKNKIFPNYALMKISAYHKSLGHQVEWWQALFSYDKVYSSKVFDFTPENPYLPPDTIKGGTGYGNYDVLPKEIDEIFPDYSIYPSCDYAIGFITRGCIRKCEWCYVPKKEGSIKPYKKWQNLVRQDSDKLVLMDNNILACEYGITQLEELGETSYKIDLNQGMDVRLLNERIVEILSKIKWIKYIRFSCDTSHQLPYFENMAKLFKKYKIPLSKVFIYLLVTKDVDEAEERVRKLTEIYKNFNLYAQSERNDKKGIVPNKIQLEFCQRYIYGRAYKNESWEDYILRNGLCDEVCQSYFSNNE